MIVNLSAYSNPHSCALTIGSFDGMHAGHRAVLEALVKKAAEERLPSVVMTFVEPPQNYIGAKKELILPSLKKLKMLDEAVDFVVVANFMDFAKMTPGDFFEEIALKRMKAASLVVGENFRFGAGRAGDAKTLERMARHHGVDIVAVPLVKAGGYEVSSTRIRQLLAEGRRAEAEELLGSGLRWEGHAAHQAQETINKKGTKG